jgi:hypothetical protein
VAIGDYQLEISGIPPTHCLRHLVYNGARTDGQSFTMNPYALAHAVELVVDDHAAAVSGSVWSDDKRVARPWVVLARWPPGTDVFQGTVSVAGDDDGQFNFQGLVPGEYRLVSVPLEAKGELERPGVLEELLRAAEKLLLTGRQAATIQVKLNTPTRP